MFLDIMAEDESFMYLRLIVFFPKEKLQLFSAP